MLKMKSKKMKDVNYNLEDIYFTLCIVQISYRFSICQNEVDN